MGGFERAVSCNRENPVRVIDKELELLEKVSYAKKNLREVWNNSKGSLINSMNNTVFNYKAIGKNFEDFDAAGVFEYLQLTTGTIPIFSGYVRSHGGPKWSPHDQE